MYEEIEAQIKKLCKVTEKYGARIQVQAKEKGILGMMSRSPTAPSYSINMTWLMWPATFLHINPF